MTSKNKILDLFFIVEVVLFGLIITGVLPRETALYLGAALIIYFLKASLDDSLVFFVRSIPLFLAMPLTAGFDNFNIWRILAVILFLKWLFGNSIEYYVLNIKNYWLKNLSYKKPSYLLVALLLLSILSVIPAPDKIAAIKRIIYFLNFAILGLAVYGRASDKEFAKRLIRNSVIPVIIVATVGYFQVISTYFIDIYQFMRIWGEEIQCRQFGEQWCNIAVQLGNTWFAYYGEQLSLRVFSLFPDSHSFPQFILLGIPAVLAVLWQRINGRELGIRNFKKQIPMIIILALLFLITILSGTRGIWAASVGVVFLAFILICRMRRSGTENERKILFKNIIAHLIIFFLAFFIAFPIFSSPQFLVSKDNSDILKNRLKSIIDFGETSNNQRIEIWNKTLFSIKEYPLSGVGIGNYPVVLEQDIRLAKAGSSAHNLYLHVAAETGILAGIIFIWFLWILFKKNYELFILENDKQLRTYFAAALLYVPWVLIYSLTDIAIFDERTFLMFTTVSAIILGIKSDSKN